VLDHALDAPVAPDEAQRRLALVAHALHHGQRVGRLRRRHDAAAGPDHGGLLRRDPLERVAEYGHVVVANRRDDRFRDGRDRVGRVEASAQPSLDHGDLYAGAPEVLEGERALQLEVQRRALARRAQPIDGRSQRIVHDRRQGVGRDERAVDPDALAVVDQMRRGEQPRAVAGGAQARGDHGRGRALTLGPHDMDNAIGAVGMVQQLQQPAHAVEGQDLLAGRPALEVGERVQIG